MLTDAKIKAAKARGKPYKLADAGQLYLYVSATGGRHWRMNYTFGLNDRGKPAQKTLSFGSYPIVTLSEARGKRDEAKGLIAQGRDPTVVRREDAAQAGLANAATFEIIARRWHTLQKPRWSAVHAKDVLRGLEADIFPAIGAMPIADIKANKLLDTLNVVEDRGAIETARRLCQQLSAIFVYGIATGIVDTDPAGSLHKALKPKPRVKPQPSIIDGNRDQDERLGAIRQLLIDCEAERCRATTKLALRFLALTAVRPGELRWACWDEIEDLDGSAPLWRIPAARMKGDEERKAEELGEHMVPLAPQAVQVLRVLHRLTGDLRLMFPSDRHVHRPISENTLRALLIRAGYYQRHVPHGFRAAFSTLMNERARMLGKPEDRAIIDLMLAHIPKDRVEGAYTLGMRLAVTGLNADEWQISNTRPKDRSGKQSYVAGRLITEWEPTSTLRFSMNINGWIDKSDPQALQLVGVRPGVPAVATTRVLNLLANVPFTRNDARSADWSTGIYEPRSKQTMIQAALRTDLDLSDAITMTSLTSYVHYKRNQAADGDGTSLISIDFPIQDAKISAFNQELRLSNAATSSVRWVVGANLEKSKTREYQELNFIDQTNNNPSNLNISQSGDLNRQNILNYAFFGNGEFDATNKLTLKAGVRYTQSRIRNDNCIVATDTAMRDLFNLLGGLLGSVPFTPIQTGGCLALNDNLVPGEKFHFNLKQHNVSWRVGVDYKLVDNVLIYANGSRGFKAGSFPTLAASTFVQLRPVTQERVTSYEAGVKARLWDGKAQFNVAAFYSDYRDKQIKGKLLDPIFNILDALVNVPKSRIQGVETELTVRPAAGLTFSGSLTYLNSKVQRYAGANVIGVTQNFAGEPLPFTPKWSYATDVEYRHRSSGRGTPFVGATVHGQSASDAALGGGSFEFPNSPLVRLAPELKYAYHINPFAVVDLRVGYEAEDGNWRVMLWGKNVLDKYYWTNVIPALDTSARLAGRPATYGVTFGVDFR